MNVAFVYLDNGVDVELDHCTADQGVKVGNGSNEQTRITNSELGAIEISGKTAVVENVTTTGRTSVSASEMEVHDSNFGGLSIGGDSDIGLENIKSLNADSGIRGGALSADGVGDVIVKDCVFANEKGYAITSLSAPIKIESGYFKGAADTVYGAYTTPEGKILGDVTEGEDLSEAQATAATKALTAAKAKLVKMKTQTITVSVKNSNGVVSKKYGDKAFYLGAKGKGGLIYKSSNTRIATVDSKGKVTFKKLSGNSGIAVSSTGRFTVKKGLKKGTYRVKVKITAGARGNYNAGSKTVTVTVKVK